MKKALIHQTPEEKLASSSNEIFLETQKTNQLLTDLKSKKDFTTSELAKAFFSMVDVKRGYKGDKGDKGEAPIKGIDYVDGKDGRTPFFIGSKEPSNPQKGDLWYQD